MKSCGRLENESLPSAGKKSPFSVGQVESLLQGLLLLQPAMKKIVGVLAHPLPSPAGLIFNAVRKRLPTLATVLAVIGLGFLLIMLQSYFAFA